MEIIEEKLNYDGKIDRVKCLLLRRSTEEVVLLYRISKKYKTDEFALPIGSFTIAYYYFNKPYNLYHWISPQGKSLGYYFNMVKDVHLTNNILHYKDLIIDILIDNDLTHTILDIDELPCPLEVFENGQVQKNINDFLVNKKEKIDYFKNQSEKFISLGLQSLWDKNM